MSPSHNNPSTEPTDANAQLAHELANLLDGSLRHLGIAIDTLSQGHRPTELAAPTEATGDDILDRLQTTDRSMRQMASLIKAWMKSAPKPRELFEQAQTLKKTLEQVIETHRPAANRYGIDIVLQLEPTAANLPAGPVFPVIANAILNSIQAIAHTPGNVDSKQHRIGVTVRLEAGLVSITVSDNGPGIDPEMLDEQGNLRVGHTTKPDGHGLGLMLSRQIAHSLEGSMKLIPNPDGGTRMTLRYPVTSLGPNTKTDAHANLTTHQE